MLSGHSAGVNSVALDVAGGVAATCSADGTGRLWDLGSCQCVHVLAGHGGNGLGARLTQDLAQPHPVALPDDAPFQSIVLRLCAHVGT